MYRFDRKEEKKIQSCGDHTFINSRFRKQCPKRNRDFFERVEVVLIGISEYLFPRLQKYLKSQIKDLRRFTSKLCVKLLLVRLVWLP